MLARDKGISKKLLSYHRIPVPEFAVFRMGTRRAAAAAPRVPAHRQVAHQGGLRGHRADVARRRRRQAGRARGASSTSGSRTDAIVERFIDGRELYVGILGNGRLQVFPVWELLFTKAPDELPTHRHREGQVGRRLPRAARHHDGARQGPARRADRRTIKNLCKRIYRVLELSRLRPHRPASRRRGPGLRARGQPESAARLRRGLRRVGREGGRVVQRPHPAHRQPGAAARPERGEELNRRLDPARATLHGRTGGRHR